MSERLLDAFREDAEHSIALPDFDDLASAGRRRRARRRAVAGAVAACTLAASGLLATYGRSATPDPAKESPDTSAATPYPGMTMTTLEPGTYVIRPFTDPALPEVRFTIPAGWNAWLGPNRFAGLDEVGSSGPRARQDALESEPAWLLGMLVLDTQWIAQPGCTMVDLQGADVATVVEALQRAPRLRVVSGPQDTDRLGFPAAHLRLRQQSPHGTCRQTTVMNTTQGGIDYLETGTTYDTWVVDAGGRTLLLWSAWTRGTPRPEVQDLLGIVDSIELVPPDAS